MTALALLLMAPVRAQEYSQLSSAIHMSSRVSDGKYSLEEIADIAGRNGVRVLIPADRDSMTWEYGIMPLRNIAKRTVEERSVFSFGIIKYLKLLDSIRKEHPDMIIIPGIESAPYYYWQGSVFDDNLVIKDWHKHLLVIGLSKSADLEYLPVLGNPKGLRQPPGLRNIILFWPLALFALGVLCARRRAYSYTDISGKALGPYSGAWRVIGISAICVSLVFLINNYPFLYQKFDQYHGNRGVIPYQNLIDYANGRGGLTFWAHPEASNVDKTGPVGIETEAHSEYLLKARDYTGFAVFYEGYQEVGAAGGIWDRILLEYCRGDRKSPIWAIGGLAFDKAGDLSVVMNDVRTVLLCRGSDAAAALEAMKKGRMYCSRGKDSSSFVLDEFTVSGGAGIGKTMGEESVLRQDPQITIEGHLLRGQDKTFTIQLIKDGLVVKDFEARSPFRVSYVDTDTRQGRSYYRLEIKAQDLLVISNPIFVQKRAVW